MKKITAEEAYKTLKAMPLKSLTLKNRYRDDNNQYCLVGYLAQKFTSIDLEEHRGTFDIEKHPIDQWYNSQPKFMRQLNVVHIDNYDRPGMTKSKLKQKALNLLRRYLKK
jgi:hypothetical protein